MNKDEALAQYRAMLLIRRFEERCAQLYQQTKIRGFLHLYDGEEAVAVGTGRETGIVHLDVTTTSAELSRQIADQLLQEVERFNLQTRQSRGAAERAFIEERVARRAKGDIPTLTRDHHPPLDGSSKQHSRLDAIEFAEDFRRPSEIAPCLGEQGGNLVQNALDLASFAGTGCNQPIVVLDHGKRLHKRGCPPGRYVKQESFYLRPRRRAGPPASEALRESTPRGRWRRCRAGA